MDTYSNIIFLYVHMNAVPKIFEISNMSLYKDNIDNSDIYENKRKELRRLISKFQKFCTSSSNFSL